MRVPATTEENRSSGVTPTAPWRVAEVSVLQHHRLRVRFLDGTVGEVDLSGILNRDDPGVFTKLRNENIFEQVSVQSGVVTWPGEIDLAPDAMYEACRVMARHVEYRGRYQWDFSRVLNGPVDPEFSRLIESYLSSVLNSGEKRRGWKIPETTLVFPWITRLFPDINYIYWIRDPRDGILKKHKTDDLSDFGIPYEPTDDLNPPGHLGKRILEKLKDAVTVCVVRDSAFPLFPGGQADVTAFGPCLQSADGMAGLENLAETH